MSSLYLIRHGQAGTRHDYDALSDTGRRQARLLGRYLAAQGVRFRAAVSGGLRRQRETAEEAVRAAREAGLDFPEPTVDPGWNEFDLEMVYREMAPAIAAEDPLFREQYAGLMRQAADVGHSVHRTWSPCDAAIVRAWIEGRYPVSGESWLEFLDRVRGCRVPACAEGEAVAIFTSAVPIAIWVGLALGVENGRILRVAGVMHNTAVTVLRRRPEELLLFSFNGVPHLPEPGLRTFR